jgi:hypothetical protein
VRPHAILPLLDPSVTGVFLIGTSHRAAKSESQCRRPLQRRCIFVRSHQLPTEPNHLPHDLHQETATKVQPQEHISPWSSLGQTRTTPDATRTSTRLLALPMWSPNSRRVSLRTLAVIHQVIGIHMPEIHSHGVSPQHVVGGVVPSTAAYCTSRGRYAYARQ